MDIEFHYYVTYILARRGGFSTDDARVIAYASQYTDDNDVIFTINKGKGGQYSNWISQTMNILKPKRSLMHIYPLFHFFPGDPAAKSARRRDGAQHILNTTPDGERVNKLIDDALETGDLYRVGIATHTFIDSWAHQNFIGYYDRFNSLQGVTEQLTPDIGHADAMHSPDIPNLLWRDGRLVRASRKVQNKERFIEASSALLRKYAVHNGMADAEVEALRLKLIKNLDWAIGSVSTAEVGEKARIKRYAELEADLPAYHSSDWFSAAVDTDVLGLPDTDGGGFMKALRFFPDKQTWREDYKDSHWYKFQQAVKVHQDEAWLICKDIFEQVEVT